MQTGKERNTMKKLTALLLALLVIISITACTGTIPGLNNSLEVGDIVQLGKLDWIVLTVDGGRALLLSEKVLETRAFDSSLKNWENSDIRAYLNGSFFETTFNDQEKRRIADTRLTTAGQNRTDDKIFLLSIEEINEYMGDTAHLNMRNARIAENITTGNVSWWWLRSPGNFSITAAYVNGDGVIYGNGRRVDGNYGGVRPALWINP